MSDDTTTVEVSPETRTWARQILDQYRAVESLHSPFPMWTVPDVPDEMFDDVDEAVARLHTVDSGGDASDLTQYTFCRECKRIEDEFGEVHGLEEWGTLNALWPCSTARALGATS